MSVRLMQGDCIERMKEIEDDSVDSIVTDPPYGLGFMGKKWDVGVPAVDVFAECLRVLKPGGHLLAFAGTRTQHRMATAIEDAGFEIRDMIAWVYGSGFPKSLNVSKAIDKAAGAEREVVGSKLDLPGYHLNGHADTGKYGHGVGGSTPETRLKAAQITAPATPEAQQWDGWGTALKPALEPITVARKPLAKGNTVAANVLAHGTGALNVDGCRVDAGGDKLGGGMVSKGRPKSGEGWDRPWMHDPEVTERKKVESSAKVEFAESQGRWPANLIHDGSDEVVGLFPVSKDGVAGKRTGVAHVTLHGLKGRETAWGGYGQEGSAARFFYCAKASKKDRGEGNKHPTVKPTDLMRYLVRLVTPPGDTVLDFTMGSGSTGVAAIKTGRNFIGIELDPEYFALAEDRIYAASMTDDLFAEVES